ncbi:DUF2065 domain-containing protein [Leucothrix pacifica]|uniref:DUF2065 domain-containing protein n=1 Tax=Leucothrix pacifica TaxID=1247513 RepID=A0A317CRI2_9GAMM|nr:DUF2065 domain-containing protein [Leucothrix pacifica]PWQ99040.1 DUF2065 domain-containing protein [Leucothrix pacifica]
MNINWNDLLTAFALVLIIEGLLPFAAPSKIKEVYQSMLQMPNKTLRSLGLGSMVAGLILLFLI